MRNSRAVGALRTRTLVCVSLALATGITTRHGLAQVASSQPVSAAEGTIIAIDGTDLIVDLGAAKGARKGQVVELWRPMHLRHPVTGEALVDRFRIGTVTLTQVQPTLSLAQVKDKPLRTPVTGDQVVIAVSEPRPVVAAPSPILRTMPESPVPAPPPVVTPAPATPPGAATPAPAPRTDADAVALADLFASLRGQPPEARARAYEAFVARRPNTRFAATLREEIALLRARPDVAPVEEERRYEFSHSAFGQLEAGRAQILAVELDPRVVGAVLHARPKHAIAFRSTPMKRVGDGYWSATVPADIVREPGLEYFVEGVLPKGSTVAIVGSAEAPRDADVNAPPLMGKAPGTLGQMTVQSEYASFNAKKADDFVFQTEGTFGWRKEDTGIRAVRSGFGVLRGRGGGLSSLAAGSVHEVGLTYGYLEGEIGLTPIYGVVARPILGLQEGGISGGAQTFFRIGNDLRTNLLIGGEVLGSVGMRGIVELNWRTIPRVPILVRSEVTNQPAGTQGDVGVRAITQAGYEVLPDLTLAARVSYQGRTINHAGPGAGLGVGYQW